MKTVGIIGGLGPETTAKFYQAIIASCFERNKDKRPPILMWSVPLPYKIEEDLIKNAQGGERYLPYLREGAQWLEKGGAEFLVIPCNTVHIFIEEVRKSVQIPVLSIVEETIKFLKEKGISEVGMLATTSLIKSGLYTDKFTLEGIKIILPNKEQQSRVGEVIFNLVNYSYTNQDEKQIIDILDDFELQGVKIILFACTDLQLLDLSHPNLKIYDTMKILADAAVKNILMEK